MPQYNVCIRTVSRETYVVEAENEDDAKNIYLDGLFLLSTHESDEIIDVYED